MYSVDSLEYAVSRFYRSGIENGGCTPDMIEKLLEGIDYDALLQAVRHNAETVPAYATQGRAPKSFNYRGRDLFGQRATLLYEDADQHVSTGAVETNRSIELWLLEDMGLTVAACVSVSFEGGAYVSEYREIKDGGDPWDCGLCLDLEDLTAKLRGMCGPSYEGNIPYYEL